MAKKKKWLLILGIILLLFIVLAAIFLLRINAGKGELLQGSIIHDAETRFYYLYLPENYDPSEKVPLLFNFHGLKSSAIQNILYADFRHIADRENFLLVYPQGLKHKGDTHWSVGGWTPDSTVDDVGFIDALIDELDAKYNVDMDRVFSTGMSNGGAMSFHLALNLGHRFRAIASVAAPMTPETRESAKYSLSEPMPVMLIYGTDDKIVPFESGVEDHRVLTLEETLEFWIERNGIPNKTPAVYPLENRKKFDSTESEYHVYAEGKAPLEVYRVIRGGHTWPGGPGLLRFLGRTGSAFSASEVIWEFFSRQ